ncbi:TPA: BLUF domain-containing protein [Stenotrophomonas maltophilia]|uniref:BLUF domain-containing protein n=1 Tax=Stenotrophomonas maltophilia TaxID=40324 RepID=UPI0013D9B5E4|nr:BLUF domain-containing protein [Stenotrophomonas maltophilia]MBN4990704.1 BLUF domain-containing protein [Stenotrophomonas maltophilia]MCI1132054.1 BLUF domain-containing protein [Stenotrophomonas maltophilia]MCI1148963.1 BLUF domain-containing protein [Stenotrophomonas maltophilia]HDX0925538.1 BLUF domain-containing protein [Stenotrophomonas maltophilia]
MPIRAVVYVSSAGEEIAGDKLGLSNGKLDQIVDDAARFNRDAGVTGVLLFDGERFLQYLEGPEDGLSVAYSRVLSASSHNGIVELQRGRVGQRRLPFWPMRWLPVEPEELRRLAHADWTRFNQRGDAEDPNATAMEILAGLVEPYAIAA